MAIIHRSNIATDISVTHLHKSPDQLVRNGNNSDGIPCAGIYVH